MTSNKSFKYQNSIKTLIFKGLKGIKGEIFFGLINWTKKEIITYLSLNYNYIIKAIIVTKTELFLSLENFCIIIEMI